MSITLNVAIERVEGLLRDSANVRFSEADLALGVRLALAEIWLAAGELLALEGLDGALETSLPAHLEALLATGGAGYAALARAAARADWEMQDAGEFRQLHRWGEERLRDFRALLRQTYPVETARLRDQRRSAAPWAAWTDDFGERGGEEAR